MPPPPVSNPPPATVGRDCKRCGEPVQAPAHVDWRFTLCPQCALHGRHEDMRESGEYERNVQKAKLQEYERYHARK